MIKKVIERFKFVIDSNDNLLDKIEEINSILVDKLKFDYTDVSAGYTNDNFANDKITLAFDLIKEEEAPDGYKRHFLDKPYKRK